MSSYRSSNENKWGKPPPGYIPGYGRGAVGFTTRADIGNAKTSEVGFSINNSQLIRNMIKDGEIEKEDYFKEYKKNWENDDKGLLINNIIDSLDKEDIEAEVIYNRLDEYLGNKRKKKIEEKEKEEKDLLVKDEFLELKSKLGIMSTKEWNMIPDVEVMNKKERKEKYTYIPDKFIIERNEYNKEDKSNVLTSVIDKYTSELSSSLISGRNSVNPKGYLTELDEISNKNSILNTPSDFNIGIEGIDYSKAKRFLQTAIDSELTGMSNSWSFISLARLEKSHGHIKNSREVIKKGLEKIKNDEELWIEASSYFKYDESIEILKKGAENIPNSESLWKAYSSRVKDSNVRFEILKEAIENIPTSKYIWKEILNEINNKFSTEENNSQVDELKQVKLAYLQKAVEMVPNEIEFWIEYSKNESYEKAKNILNKGRKLNPKSLTIWISAIMLEEDHYKEIREKEKNESFDETYMIVNKIETMIEKSNSILSKNGYNPTREEYIEEADILLKLSYSISSEAIIKLTILKDYSIYTKEETKKIWRDIINVYILHRQSYDIVRKIYKILYENDNEDISIWYEALMFEEKYGNVDLIIGLYEKGIELYKDYVNIWLMYVKYIYLRIRNSQLAVEILERSINEKGYNPDIVISLSKILLEIGEETKARVYLIYYHLLLNKAYDKKRNDDTIINEALFKYYSLICTDFHEKYEKEEIKTWGNKVNKEDTYNENINKVNAYRSNKISYRVLMKLINIERIFKNYEISMDLCDKIVEYSKINEFPNRKVYNNEEYSENTKYFIKIVLIKSYCILESSEIANKPISQTSTFAEITNKSLSFLLEMSSYIQNNEILYINIADLLIKNNQINKARTILETGRIKCGNTETLLYKSIKLDISLHSFKTGIIILTKALSLFPNSGLLNSLLIDFEEKVERKEMKGKELLFKFGDNEYVLLELAKYEVMFKKSKMKAIEYLERGINANSELGDLWLLNYRINDEKGRKELEERICSVNVRYGDVWISISKDIRNWKCRKEEILIKSLEVDIYNYI